MAQDYYELLGVSRDADEEEIKTAYRKLAMEYHPDRSDHDDAEQKFKKITEAYEVLRDPEKRKMYDQFGEAGVKQGAGRGGGRGGFQDFGGFDFSDAFEVFMNEFGAGGGFGGRGRGSSRGRGSRSERGPDQKVSVSLSLEEAARGVEREVGVHRLDRCDRCEGSGAEPGTSPSTCSTCNGQGEVRQSRRSMLGQMVSVQPCPDCRGKGEVIEDPCSRCRGEGRVRKERTLEIEVPAGVSSDDYLKLRGQGSVGPKGGPRGHLVVELDVEDDPRFQREGDDLVHEMAITFSQAALGDTLEVPTIDGTAELKVPAGVQSGQALRLEGRGMPRLRGSGRGDQIVRVRVWTPSDLTAEQREALEELREMEDEPPAPEQRESGLWEKVKRAFTA